MIKEHKPHYSLVWTHTIADVPQVEWDALAMPLKTPFLEWNWLHNLEISQSVTANTGWLPNHLILWRDRTLIAAAPLYLKGHSQGEFVFDHQWAELASRLGIDYYPKLLGMTPFTPAEGYRFLIAAGENEEEITALMLHEIDSFCVKNRISGCHFLYVDPQWRPILESQGFTTWLHHSYIWENANFQTFDDYLTGFNANQRRNIKRERKAVEKAGLRLQALTGEEIPNSMFPLMYDFYADTCDKFGWWGSKYLTKQFFQQLQHNYRHRVVFFAAYYQEDPGQPVGMSFCLFKEDKLYGRYWGSFQDIDCLHFDACYYTPIAWAIAHGIQNFDPGAGGKHKKRRGFPATPNYSLHRFYNHRLGQIILPWVREVNQLEQKEMDAINAELPFK
ncbi:N-acetyltransferase [Dolichospermum sp. LEGE 00240]|jgi:predicted N-acyltransferase|uniref:GNAT family N-acetyltransferase n=1 Tax=Aphanizomenonaceae TaxID=1892259 RepID=UPI00187E26CE|nr:MULTISPECIES: GNAT family N-acetyltransferase [Aphanizomenonaceae]MDM3843827.1 GNAT family N-acetyltransferase [Aphanizomenon gracile PMC638.10]MDM3850839.1 GNAT family N-acetyltransferase [Aphanizomenon gracile PMC627.10]MDM3854031.1 GNAT family N-acetyltransferase [Aphanizomenon gracile PMC649.10]MDM3858774.1 GNAT family N-acetyltransferase [Aphanizomenon gracile PMC644.10]MBE9249069.1 N-acetyltransferase [Dolichospermum sp. LEGE 00240]